MDDTPKRVGRPAGKDPLSPDLKQVFSGFQFRLRDSKESLVRYIPALKQCAARGIVSSTGADPLALVEIIKKKHGADVRTTGKKSATTVAEEEAHERKITSSFWEKIKAADPAQTFVLFQEKCAALLHRLVGGILGLARLTSKAIYELIQAIKAIGASASEVRFWSHILYEDRDERDRQRRKAIDDRDEPVPTANQRTIQSNLSDMWNNMWERNDDGSIKIDPRTGKGIRLKHMPEGLLIIMQQVVDSRAWETGRRGAAVIGEERPRKTPSRWGNTTRYILTDAAWAHGDERTFTDLLRRIDSGEVDIKKSNDLLLYGRPGEYPSREDVPRLGRPTKPGSLRDRGHAAFGQYAPSSVTEKTETIAQKAETPPSPSVVTPNVFSPDIQLDLPPRSELFCHECEATTPLACEHVTPFKTVEKARGLPASRWPDGPDTKEWSMPLSLAARIETVKQEEHKHCLKTDELLNELFKQAAAQEAERERAAQERRTKLDEEIERLYTTSTRARLAFDEEV